MTATPPHPTAETLTLATTLTPPHPPPPPRPKDNDSPVGTYDGRRTSLRYARVRLGGHAENYTARTTPFPIKGDAAVYLGMFLAKRKTGDQKNPHCLRRLGEAVVRCTPWVEGWHNPRLKCFRKTLGYPQVIASLLSRRKKKGGGRPKYTPIYAAVMVRCGSHLSQETEKRRVCRSKL